MAGGEPLKHLTAEQRELVSRNIGLVGVHLRHHVPTPPHATRQRDYDDLFQEGCVALMRAAASYDPARDGAFPAYALPRIRGAIHTALHEYFTTIRVPTRVVKRTQTNGEHGGGAMGVTVQELTEELSRSLATEDADRAEGDALRHVMHRRFERAIRLALAELASRIWRHRNPLPIMRRIAAERLLVSPESERTPLRQIARDFNVSSGRASAYEQQLTAVVRAQLAADPQVTLLARVARKEPRGYETRVDPPLRERLLQAELDGFETRFARLRRDEQAELVFKLIEQSSPAVFEVVRNLYHLTCADEDGPTAVAAVA